MRVWEEMVACFTNCRPRLSVYLYNLCNDVVSGLRSNIILANLRNRGDTLSMVGGLVSVFPLPYPAAALVGDFAQFG
jgi:hypothetical protein